MWWLPRLETAGWSPIGWICQRLKAVTLVNVPITMNKRTLTAGENREPGKEGRPWPQRGLAEGWMLAMLSTVTQQACGCIAKEI